MRYNILDAQSFQGRSPCGGKGISRRAWPSIHIGQGYPFSARLSFQSYKSDENILSWVSLLVLIWYNYIKIPFKWWIASYAIFSPPILFIRTSTFLDCTSPLNYIFSIKYLGDINMNHSCMYEMHREGLCLLVISFFLYSGQMSLTCDTNIFSTSYRLTSPDGNTFSLEYRWQQFSWVTKFMWNFLMQK